MDLRTLILSCLPAERRSDPYWQAWLAGQLGTDRKLVSVWMRTNKPPAKYADAICRLITAPPEVRRQIEDLAGWARLPADGSDPGPEGGA